MDKNTLWGLLLMGAVILGFMYINQPSAEERERMERERQELLARETQKTPDSNYLTIDSVTNADRQAILATVKNYGITDSVTNITTLASGAVNLNLNNGELGGYVTANNTQVPVKDILTANYGSLPRATASMAVKELKQTLANIMRYGGFAHHLSGDSTTVKLENDVLSLEISNKGGAISRATLKEYNSYDSTKVSPIAPGTDSYGFILTSATQRFDTREFFFTPVIENDSTVLMQLQLGNGSSWGIRYTLPKHGYLVKMDVVQQGMQSIIPPSVSTIDMVWNQKWHATKPDEYLKNATAQSTICLPTVRLTI